MKLDIFKLDEKSLIVFIKTSVTIGILGVLTTIGVFLFKGYINSNDIDSQKLSAFGEFIGGFIGIFFTLAATFLIWLTYSNQKKELAETIKIAKEQGDTLKIQQFENTYFNLLRNIQVLIGNMVSINGNSKGKKYLHDLFEEFSIAIENDNKFQTLKIATEDTKDPKELELIKTAIMTHYDKIFEQNSSNLGHFFRFIHNIIKYVNDELRDNEILRRKYLSFLQAQLSNDELGFILYNSLSKYSLDKNNKPTFKDFIDDYGVLENIDNDCVFHLQLSEFFPKTNFFYKRQIVV